MNMLIIAKQKVIRIKLISQLQKLKSRLMTFKKLMINLFKMRTQFYLSNINTVQSVTLSSPLEQNIAKNVIIVWQLMTTIVHGSEIALVKEIDLYFSFTSTSNFSSWSFQFQCFSLLSVKNILLL